MAKKLLVVNCESFLVFFITFQAKKGVTDGRKGKESQTEEISTAGAEEFLKFETQLAKSAKELKGELLKTQLKSVIEKSENVIEKLKSIVEERKELKIDHLEKKLTSLKDGGEELSEIFSKAKRSMLTDLDAKFKQVVRKIDESAKKKKPLDVGNKELEVTLTMVTEKANEDLKDWCARMNSVLPLPRKSVLMKESEIEQMKSEEMPKDRYNCYIDPYTYYTSNRAWTFLVTGGICFALTGVGVGE